MVESDKENLFNCVNFILDKSIKQFVKECLKIAPAYFWVVPPSSTGRFHPNSFNCKGGLVKHTISVVQYGILLCNKNSIRGSDKDIIVASCVLHDTCKAGVSNHIDNSKFPIHAYLPREHYKRVDGISSSIRSEIFNAVDTHMSQWQRVPKHHGVEIEMPKTVAQKIVVYADYLATEKVQPVEDYREILKDIKAYDESIAL